MKCLHFERQILFCLFYFAITIGGQCQFIKNGSAEVIGIGEYRLTPNVATQIGAIWYQDKISLNQSFTIKFQMFLGENDAGADGLTFTLQPISNTVGVSGGGLGVEGISPALILEFDTYQNAGDPTYDHVALQKNGSMNHSAPNSLVNPIRLQNGVDNFEDGLYHPMEITWDADAQIFRLFVHCELRLEYQGDIVKDVFSGDDQVFWGFTASTGGATNLQKLKIDATDLLKIPDLEICSGNSAEVVLPVRGKSFKWVPELGVDDVNSPITTISSLDSRQYIIEYEDYCNDVLRDTFDLVVNNAAVLNLGNDSSLCEGESVVLKASAGESWLWNNGETTSSIEVNLEGTYSVVAVNSLKCAARDSITLLFHPKPIPEILGDSSFCQGDSTKLSLSLKYDHVIWNSNVEKDVFVPKIAQTVRVEVSDSIGCVGTDSLDVLQRETPAFSLGEDLRFCEGDSSLLSISNGDSWKWSSGEITQDLLVFESMTVVGQATSKYGCKYTDTVEVTEIKIIAIDLGEDVEICADSDSLIIDIGNSIVDHVLWNTQDLSRSITVFETGTYWVEIDSGGCMSSDTIEIIINEMPFSELGSDTNICAENLAELVLDAGGNNFNYQWSTSENTNQISPQKEGVFTVLISSNEGCEIKDSIRVSTISMQPIDLGEDIKVCSDETSVELQVDHHGFSNVLWSDQSTFHSISVFETGSYWVRVDSAGCKSLDSVFVQFNDLPISQLQRDTVVCLDDSNYLTIIAGSRSNSYSWSNGGDEATIIVTEPGIYEVVITSNEGCSLTDQVEIKEYCPYSFYIPNTFTPNGDGLNDQWFVSQTEIIEYELLIFNRWGELIWEGNQDNTNWDGTANGSPVQEDVYVYKVTYSWLQASGIKDWKTEVGTVTLIR